MLHIIKIKVKQLHGLPLISCCFTLQITHDPWCVTMKFTFGNRWQWGQYFLVSCYTVCSWTLSFLSASLIHGGYLWNEGVTLSLCWKHNEQVWKCFKILMQKYIKCVKLYSIFLAGNPFQQEMYLKGQSHVNQVEKYPYEIVLRKLFKWGHIGFTLYFLLIPLTTLCWCCTKWLLFCRLLLLAFVQIVWVPTVSLSGYLCHCNL